MELFRSYRDSGQGAQAATEAVLAWQLLRQMAEISIRHSFKNREDSSPTTMRAMRTIILEHSIISEHAFELVWSPWRVGVARTDRNTTKVIA